MPKGKKGIIFVKLTCLECGGTFEKEYRLRKQRYCSRSCGAKASMTIKRSEKFKKWRNENQHPLLGKKMSNETKNKISKANKGKENHLKNKTYKEYFGEKKSKNIREKMSNSLKKFHKNNEYIHWTEKKDKNEIDEIYKTHSKKLKIKYQNGEMESFIKGKTFEEYYGDEAKNIKNKISNTRKEKIASGKIKKSWNEGLTKENDARILKASKKMSKNWLSEKRMKHLKTIFSKLEENFINLLQENNIDFKRQKRLDGKCYDFYIPKNNLLIEVDGDWHHCNPNLNILPKHDMQKRNIKNDKLKNEIAKKYDYKLIRFWEHDIKNNIDQVKQQLFKELN